MPTLKQVYQLKVTVDDVRPPTWRRLLVSGDTNLLTLHKIIQEPDADKFARPILK